MLVNDLYIGDPLEANKTQEICITPSPAVCIGHTTVFLNRKHGSSVVRHLKLLLEVPGSIPARGE